MTMPFERLMEFVAGFDESVWVNDPGSLARQSGQPESRVADAIAAVRVFRGDRTHVSAVDIRAQMHPLVRKVLEEDRRGLASGFASPDLFA